MSDMSLITRCVNERMESRFGEDVPVCCNVCCWYYNEDKSSNCDGYKTPYNILACSDSQIVISTEAKENDSAESDSSGDKEPSGNKFDDGKPQLSKLFMSFPDALSAVAVLHTEGAKKHGSIDNWKNVPGGYERYTDSLLRHVMESASGSDYDDDAPGFLHDINVLWNALTRLQLMLEGSDIQLRKDTTEE